MSQRFGPPYSERSASRGTSVIGRIFRLTKVDEAAERLDSSDRFYDLRNRFRAALKLLPANVPGSHAKKDYMRSLIERLAVVRQLPESIRERDFGIISPFVNAVNDVTEMVEAGLVDVDYFLGKYHLSLIREVFIAEAYVFYFNLYADSGRWGMRVLRAGEMAREYNDMSPIQRQPVRFRTDPDFGVIYAPPGGRLLWPSKLIWLLRRRLRLYPTLTARSKRQQQRLLETLRGEMAKYGTNDSDAEQQPNPSR